MASDGSCVELQALIDALQAQTAALQPLLTLVKTVFVTTATFDGNLGGLAGADEKCQAAADASSIVPSGTYRAWLSDSTGSPSTRFQRSTGPYVLPDGTIIAAHGYADLTNGTLNAPIDQTETGGPTSPPGTTVWSNTASAGTPFFV